MRILLLVAVGASYALVFVAAGAHWLVAVGGGVVAATAIWAVVRWLDARQERSGGESR